MTQRSSIRQPGIMIIGSSNAVSVGAYVRRAAHADGMAVHSLYSEKAQPRSRILQSISHHLFSGFPLLARGFNTDLRTALAIQRPAYLLTTGKAPVLRDTLVEARRLGVKSINYSTDDPWNPKHKAEWYLQALKEYDIIGTPRPATIGDFELLGAKRVIHTPFAYCPSAHLPRNDVGEANDIGDVFFAGGCDNDRVGFFEALAHARIQPILYGGYWNRVRTLKRFYHGFASLSDMALLHARTPVSVCLVRRANRDGHVMRTYEAAAMGACLAMEDTPDHRHLFGPDGESVVYFSDPRSLVSACQRLLADPALRQRLRVAARKVVVAGEHTYANRLRLVLKAAQTP